ncbi:MAG: glycogen debranching enzyme family protein [Phycisphaerales bacterium]|nr:glycogen debranching enzyme family protein [Phycisphaerales bacterium]
MNHQRNLHPLIDAEWVLPTGNGGFAMGTGLGLPRRKYHCYLIGSCHPPVERVALLNTLEDQLVLYPGSRQEQTVDLATYRVVAGGSSAGILRPSGYDRLIRFEKEADTARWIIRVGTVEIVKELRMGWRRNSCTVRYTVRTDRDVRLQVRPRVTLRDFHDTLGPGGSAGDTPIGDDRLRARAIERGVEVSDPAAPKLTTRIVSDKAAYAPAPHTLRGVVYDLEADRHQPDREDLFSPGVFSFDVKASGGAGVFTIAAAMAPDEADPADFDRRERAEHLSRIAARMETERPGASSLAPLAAAADDFLVPRRVGGKPLMTVLAGFPWFADWGRDTMISLVGLMIATRRLDDALGCLETFARHTSQGMIPNRFDDYTSEPHYNTVDASLWFLHACREYVRASGDRDGFDRLLRPACEEIVEFYERGTRFNIRADPEDGLIIAGDETTQLTWMDAKRNGIVFTPRHGKCVEINALWHHGLLCLADLSGRAELSARAARVRESFNRAFWDAANSRLHDCLRPDGRGGHAPTGEVRPNQIFAVSLEFSPLDAERQRLVVADVRRHLLTPMGLRTLAPGQPNYQARFEGDMMKRDNAYHNGTVWPWLIGPFAEAVLRTGGFSPASRDEARRLIAPLIATITGPNAGGLGCCLGQIAEVYDGDDPRRAQGCMAQAWSVAEPLRIASMLL